MRTLYKWLPSILIMLVIFFVSNTKGDVINQSGLGKESYHIAGHVFLFFLLSLSYFYATANFTLSLVLTIVYSIFDEVHQIFVPGRSASTFDLAMDFLGGITSLILIWFLKYIMKTKQKK